MTPLVHKIIPEAKRNIGRRRDCKDVYLDETGDPHVSSEAVEFGKAVEDWKRKHRKPRPSDADILAIARSLGYRKA